MISMTPIEEPGITPVQHNPKLVEEIRQVSVDGAELFCRSFGNGPALIVISGGPGLPHDYLLDLSSLGSNNKVIFFDPRSCGQSTGEITDAKMNMKTFLEDIDAIRKAYGYEKVSLVGHSSGCLMVMRYAIEYRVCADKIIFLNSMDAAYTHDPAPKKDYIAGIRKIKASQAYESNKVEQIIKCYKNFFKPAFYSAENVEKLNLNMSLNAAKNNLDVREAFERTLFEPSFDYQEELKGLSIPALIMHSTDDFIPRTVAENLSRLLPGCKTIVDIAACGHFSVTEQPEIVCKHISEFLKAK